MHMHIWHFPIIVIAIAMDSSDLFKLKLKLKGIAMWKNHFGIRWNAYSDVYITLIIVISNINFSTSYTLKELI